MDESHHDARMRHLQRVAYGAVASDTERAAALAELESLRRKQRAVADAAAAAAPIESASASAPASASASAAIAASASAPAAAFPSEAVAFRGAGGAARPLTWAIATGTAALLLGIGVGWHLAARMPVAEPGPGTTVPLPTVSLDVGSVLAATVPVADSPAYAVFDRPGTPADIPALDVPEEWKQEADPRLLVSMPDGTAVYAAKPPGPDVDVCVVIVVPDQPGLGLSCTDGGAFENGLLSHEFWHDRAGTVAVTLYADGSVQVGGRSAGLPISAPDD